MPEKRFNIELTFRDKATGRIEAAGKKHIAAAKRTGIAYSRVGKRMILSMNQAARSTRKATNEIDRMRIKTSGLRRVIGRLRNALLV